MTQARFVHIVDDVPELDGQDEGPVMLVALDGFLDAGNASALAVEHLVDGSTADDRGPGGGELRGGRVLRLPRAPAAADLPWRTTTPTTRRPGWWCGC